MPTADEVEALAAKVRNWGRWGDEDQLGTLNLVTDDVRRRAAACVRTGKPFSLSLPLSKEQGIQPDFSGRINPVRTMIAINESHAGSPLAWNDDMVVMALQTATHWDGLAHASWKGMLYNGYAAATVTAKGAARLGIGNVTSLTSRGVLLDVARCHDVESLDGGYAVTAADLDAAERDSGTSVGAGDVVLVRTGHIRHARSVSKYWFASPGLSTMTVAWFHERDVAAVATDTGVFEVYPEENPDVPLPVHRLHLVDMGMTQGQNFDLEALATDCAADGVYEFLLEASPLPFTGGCGSPVNPVAVK